MYFKYFCNLYYSRYGIPDEESERFRRAVEILCPTSCQNKSIWLPSDITMIPPNFLLEHSVSLTRMLQNPGEFVIVFPKAYSCSIATGFTVSESVYFAYNHWINNIGQVFQVSMNIKKHTLTFSHINNNTIYYTYLLGAT